MTDPTDPTAPNGLQSQRYERLGVLGSGGQGVVYRAFDHWTGRAVAIKVLSSETARQPQMQERLSREQQALSALKGTAAVEVLDIYRGSDGELCLVMELLKGTNLDAHLALLEERNEHMELARVAEIFDPIVDTLEVAHKAGILHRDLKPANVFLLEAGDVRLLDFGMARLKKAKPLTAEGTVMGSPSFMAPEAWKGQSAAVDHRADVYSLGVILFRVLAGELPFSGLTLYQKFLGSTKSERPSLVAKRPELPRDADEWVALALAIDREQRFQNVRALWNAFLSTFDVEPPYRGKKRPSLWSKAKGKVKELAGVPTSSPSNESPPSKRELSFISAALARSVAHENAPAPFGETPASSDERTIELVRKTIDVGEKTVEIGPKTTDVGSDTLEISSKDLLAVENTPPDLLAVENTLPDVRLEDTLPDAARLETKLSGAASRAAVSQKKSASSKSGKRSSERNAKKRQRKDRNKKAKSSRGKRR